MAENRGVTAGGWVPDVSGGVELFNAAYTAAKDRNEVFAAVQLDEGRWTVKLDGLTALGHTVPAEAAAVLTVREQPCADVVQSLLRQAQEPGADDVFSDYHDVLRLLRRDDLRAD
ncbi:hypothetical protein [Streptodolium elevatio]|uniref:Uncharacterized protein n=1 Tax=Streptodolium elevatio TaxID=3157996 RepID=A0ABV3DSD9_9ACTN